MSKDYYTETQNGVILHVKVKPRAEKNRIKGLSQDGRFLLVEIKAPPIRGQANKELEKFLRKLFAKEAIIVSGFQAREKYVLIRGATVEEVEKVLKRGKDL
ncbi:MAG: YggU family protein [Thermoplasmata archaeon]|nr:MAG: YggU family protein [Thermoplasmata archaeon]